MSDPVSNRIAARAAREIRDGDVVNLGIGIPLLIPQFLPDAVRCILHQEGGFVGMGPLAAAGCEDPTITDAAGNRVTLLPGAACFDSALSFAIVRGGRMDCAVLGALEVDAVGNLANWIIPGKWSPGIGGGMELAQCARRVIAVLRHTDREGRPKILRQCRLPLTAARCVTRIVTELAVFAVDPQRGLVLTELQDGVSEADVRARTEADYCVGLAAQAAR